MNVVKKVIVPEFAQFVRNHNKFKTIQNKYDMKMRKKKMILIKQLIQKIQQADCKQKSIKLLNTPIHVYLPCI